MPLTRSTKHDRHYFGTKPLDVSPKNPLFQPVPTGKTGRELQWRELDRAIGSSFSPFPVQPSDSLSE